ncbi:DUF4129 domain-containing protein [Halosimplex rubrum]|uniref:DUF4129 domain-containing protein n=1 Tax=Halosimplex rubrum TaxID=869889 RepID=A0A7D5P422_9EURY|nr:DUF4129 domain-containing protein [Halosimplex rubrum]QLH76858.1 DUF4129 domain-containing protein [Halosimplex rubrum]
MNRPALLPDDGLSRALVALGVAILVVGLVVGAIAPVAGISGLGSTGSVGEPKQVDPAEVGSEGSLSAVEQQLAQRLAERARSGAVNLSSGDIEQARERVNGTEYQSLLQQYSSVANQTGNTEQTIAYRRMLEAQATFIDSLDRYNRVHDRYEAFRDAEYTAVELADARTRPDLSEYEAGSDKPSPVDETQIYRSAHRLSRLAGAVNESGTRLNRRYQRLSNLSNRNFTTTRASINESVGNVTTRQETVRDQTFVSTDLTVAEHSRTASFSDPLSIRGSVTANGSGVENGTLNVTAGNQTLEATTGPNGSFAVSYRPALVSANTSSVTVAYVPENDSAHAPVSERLNVKFTRETPHAEVTAEPESLSYDDRLMVSGWVSVEGTGVPDAPYVILVGGQVFARNETDETGRFDASEPLSSSVADGERTVRVLVPLEDRTLASTSANTTVDIVELGTNLSAAATDVDGQTVRVSGRFSRLNGGGIPNQTADIAVNGTSVATTETTANGSFATAVAVPSAQLDGGLLGGSRTIGVEASYQDTGSNLAPSRATDSLTVRTSGQPVLLGGLAALVIALGGGALLARRRPWEAGGGEAGGDGLDEPMVSTGQVGRSDEDTTSLLAAAREQLGSDPETAIRVGYAALRDRIERRNAVPGDGRTHWEFYRDCEAADVDEETLETLRAVTERYEQVAYAAEGVGTDAARSTIETVDSFVDESTGTTPGGSD